ncbi:MAG: dihydropteroate synthase [Akkermansiaceae bacterium]|nr:dihydropteroate synthase [Akkermansiaceae bacterium]
MTNDPIVWKLRDRELDLSRRGLVMGILNVTPDSFSDGGAFREPAGALRHARRMIVEGADIVDIGGESTRPGAEPVTEPDELERTIPVVEALRAEWDGLISIDTTKAAVAGAALAAGADIVNDVSGLRGDEGMTGVCAEAGCGVVVMHMQGEPRTMQRNPEYGDVVREVRAFFKKRYEALQDGGIKRERICFDPGIGFGKTLAHNLALLANLDRLQLTGRPLLVGVSRKSFIGAVLDDPSLDHREWPTVALTALTHTRGARIHRVHSVRENREALRMMEAIVGAGPGVEGR